MEARKQSKFKVGTYRFWVEYCQFLNGGSTRRLQKRAEQRRLLSNQGSFDARTIISVPGLGKLDLAGI